MSLLNISDIPVGGNSPLLLIAGPCQVEGRDHALMCAERLSAMACDAGMGFVYKSSYDKANRTSASAARGVGMEEGLRILPTHIDGTGGPILPGRSSVKSRLVRLPPNLLTSRVVSCVKRLIAPTARQADVPRQSGKSHKSGQVDPDQPA